ncbi:MAG TPA: DUF1592 domain-containing protein, partial [Polyangiaceae bacterium]|nr:DUF1592 domain-containing protein [Polyangiaceae bacterium]
MTARHLSSRPFILVAAITACNGTITDSGGSGNAAQPPVSGGAAGNGANPSPTTTPTSNPPTTPTGSASTVKLESAANYYRVVRLTNDQWTKSVQSVLALASAPTDAENFQSAVAGTTDFTNNEQLLDVDSRAWTDYQAAAEGLAAKVSSDSALLSKLYSGTDGAGFIKAVGRRIYRRPLTSGEQSTYQALFDSAAQFPGTQSAFAKGAGLVLETMLQSPHFLYRTELGPAGSPLTPYEMAAKISLWLRDKTPDDALLDAAGGSGKYDTVDGAAALAQKLLDDGASKAVMRKFHGEFLRFGKFSQLSKVGVANYDPSLNAELAESAYLFFDRIFSSGQGVKDIFLSTKGFVSSRMATLYGGSSGPASGFEERELGANRVGYFTQLPFLILYGRNSSPDSIHRGVNIALDVLCAPLGTFAGVIPPLPEVMPGQTNRMRVDEHTKGCGSGCHNAMINPLGFAFENFDGMGAYRTTEKNGNESLAIDASGSFNFMDGPKSYKDSTELMQVLASSQQTHMCYSKRLASFGLQRNIVESDMPMLTRLATASANGSVKQVIVELVKQDAFRVRAG